MKKLLFILFFISSIYAQTSNSNLFIATEFETGHFGYRRMIIKEKSQSVQLDVFIYKDSITIDSEKRQKYIYTKTIDYQNTDNKILKCSEVIDQDGDTCIITLVFWFGEMKNVYRNYLRIDYNNIYFMYYI